MIKDNYAALLRRCVADCVPSRKSQVGGSLCGKGVGGGQLPSVIAMIDFNHGKSFHG